MRIIALLALAIPFVFGGVRLATTGSDARYLWLAFASTIVAVALNIRGIPPRELMRAPRFMLTLTACTVAASLAGYLVDARNVLAIGIVAFAFALCSTLGLALFARVRASAP